MKDLRKLVRKLVEESYGPLNVSPYSAYTAIRKNASIIYHAENNGLTHFQATRRKVVLGGLLATLGAGALVADFLYGGTIRNGLYPQNTTRGQEMTSLTELLTESSSEVVSTQPQTYTYQGRLFFDKGTTTYGTAADGIQSDSDMELGEQNAKILLLDVNSKPYTTMTDSSGDFSIDLPAGNYTLYPVINNPNTNYMYMCQSVNEFRSLVDGYNIIVGENNKKLFIGLMQGFLSFPEKGVDLFHGGYYNRDSRPGHTLAWNDRINEAANADSGTHFLADYGDTIYSFAPGVVKPVTNQDEDNWMCVSTVNPSYDLWLARSSEILVYPGQRVARYQPIAKAGNSGHTYPNVVVHLQLSLQVSNNYCILDPYLPIYPFDTVPYGCWLPSGNGLTANWLDLPQSENFNWQNYWIVEDQIQFGPPYS
jgi:hypothetical protein